MKDDGNKKIKRRPMFNELGDISLEKRRMVGGNTTNLNDFNNIKYEASSVSVGKFYN